jgi:tetratricopeptide (TPR) repeat protein
LYNRTPFPQTFLWWANPAVKVNDHYQSVFPPDVNAVFDHGKRDVSEFPIAKGTYYKVDYSPGTDISRYKNIPVPTSYMAITSHYDFVGGYENDSNGGLLHVANHHVSPGKKQWTWGNGDFGQAWDRNLTDEDGPYIELMCGVFTDNQPDFSWLMPGEEKSFTQYFMPYRDLGVLKNATKEAMVNLEVADGKIIVKAYTTAAYPAARVILTASDSKLTLLDETFDFHPATSYHKIIDLKDGVDPDHLEIRITTAQGVVLVKWQSGQDAEKPVPEPAKAAKEPADVESNEQLYLTGLHLEQYRHATRDPRDYYLEALRRDPADSRCNNALGLWYMRRGDFAKAVDYFKKAIETLTQRNPNPIDGEPFFNLGLALRFLGSHEEAYDYFYKSVWNAAWQDSGYYQLACLAAKDSKWDNALELINRSLIRNEHNQKALHLKVAILRKTGNFKLAEKISTEALSLDKFNFGILFEKYLLNGKDDHDLAELKELIRANIHNYIEFSLDYAHAGLYAEAIELISLGVDEQKENPVYPMAYYYKAWFENQSGDSKAFTETLTNAANANPEYCFPHQPESVVALNMAVKHNPTDFKALHYLGNFWYNARNYDTAIDCWEKSIAIFDGFPTAHRNLALGYFNKQNESEKALLSLEKAFQLDTTDARILMELDQLYKKLNHTPEQRLQHLEKYPELIDERDDLYLERAALYNLTGRYEDAYDLIMKRKFHPWEGGEGKVTGQYVFSLTEMAKRSIENGDCKMATDYLLRAQTYPENLGEGKLYGAQENQLLYWLGVAYNGIGDTEKAHSCWKEASKGMSEVATAMFYNDQQPDTIFYQGLSLLKLQQKEEAEKRFNMLVQYGQQHINDKMKIDYFAVSLPDLLIWEEDLDHRNKIHCTYLMGLGYLGLKKMGKAREFLDKAYQMDVNNHTLAVHNELAREDLN